MESETPIEFTRSELLEITKQTLADLISSDPVLKDLPKDVTLEEINAQLALQHGQSMTIYLKKFNGEVLSIVVPVQATVLDLKKAIKRHMTLVLSRSGDNRKISWKYVWRCNNLMAGSVKLEGDNTLLRDLGLSNMSRVTFAKILRSKQGKRK